ncbi:unnamed protein product [Allacma fusca]|uniref:Uncharacterized protein n=1 Tax=Allacma fusca TaxID=39272 RepID=A0A8J2NQA4_9HEXA|nr:unnamed protein product [Allacma fusca]
MFLKIVSGIFFLGFAAHVTCLEPITCRDGKLFGIQELVESVELTVSNCTNATTTKSDLFGCIFKGLDMFNDEKPATEKIKNFFTKIFTNKIMTEAGELTKRLVTCANNYAKSFSAKGSDLGKSGEAFADCFFDATKRFTSWVRNECKPVEMKKDETVSP